MEKVKVPDGKSFGFVTFQHRESVEYTIKLMDGIRLFQKTLRLQPRTGGVSRQVGDGKTLGVGPGCLVLGQTLVKVRS